MINRLREWWQGVHHVDVLVIRDGGTYDVQMHIRHGPYGLLLAGIMTKQEEQWSNFGQEILHLIETCSEDGTLQVPPIRILFADAQSPGSRNSKENTDA